MRLTLRKLPLPIFMKMGISSVKLTFLFALQFLIASTSKAQTFDASITMIPSALGYVNGSCQILLTETTNITNIEIELTNTVLDTVLFSYDYTYDQVNGLPQGLSFERVGNAVTLGLGTLPESLGWLGRIRTKYNGSWTDYQEFLFQ